MTVKISSIGLRGLEGYRVQVEVKEVPGLAAMVIVGLPDASVKEAKERVLASLYSFGCDVLDRKIIVHLSPPERKKHSPMFDLAMAIGILKAKGQIKELISTDDVFLGALSLDGTVQPIDGMLPAVLAAKKLGFKRIYLPYDSTLRFHTSSSSFERFQLCVCADVRRNGSMAARTTCSSIISATNDSRTFSFSIKE
nr:MULTISPECIES: magnesium chelatase domain-containing protein [unclassified Geobacillus]